MIENAKYNRIYLIGMPGCGKSNIAKKLARRLLFKYADLDQLIEEQENTVTASIFELKNESYFREKEAEVLRNTIKMKNVVIACGGGTPAYFNNMDWMLNNGFCIYLEASLQLLHHRLLQSKKERPLFKNLGSDDLLKKLSELFEQRHTYYSKANMIVNIPVKSMKLLAEQAITSF